MGCVGPGGSRNGPSFGAGGDQGPAAVRRCAQRRRVARCSHGQARGLQLLRGEGAQGRGGQQAAVGQPCIPARGGLAHWTDMLVSDTAKAGGVTEGCFRGSSMS